MSIKYGTLALGLILGIGLGSGLAGQTAEQRAKEREVLRTVSMFLERGHISGQALDDSISRRALDAYLQTLDPMRLYFHESDVDGFMDHRNALDDMLKEGDAQFANMVFDRLLVRIDERVEGAESLLQEDHDFTVDESFTVDPDARAYAAGSGPARELWRKRIKYDLLGLKVDGLSDEEARDRLLQRYRRYRDRMGQNDRNDVLGLFLNAVTTTYDPHTAYLSPKGYEDLEMQLTLNYQGIGALLQEREGYAWVEDIIPGGAAERDGKLKAGDRIVTVGQGDDGEMVDVVGMRLRNVVKLIRGEEGTVVRLGVLAEGSAQTVVYRLVRARTELPDRAAIGDVVEAGTKSDGSPLRAGVIDLPSFYMDEQRARQGHADYRSSTRDTEKILQGFEAEEVDVVVLDLRRNGGGPLSEAVGIAGLFIDRGPVVQVKQMDGSVRVYDDLETGMSWDGPLIVLTSRLSASASEIVAGAIVDYQRGLMVGDSSTHGKGTVQRIIGLGPPENGALKLTVQQFYRPSGLSTQMRGVLSDVELPSLTNWMTEGESELLNALPFDSIESVPHAKYEWIDSGMKQALREASQARCAESEVFSAVRADIALYAELRSREDVTLNLEKFVAVQEELDASRQRQRELRALISQRGDHTDAYLREVLAIAEDYLALLRG